MISWLLSLKKSFKHYLLNHDSFTPVSAMTKNDIEKIINKIKEKDESDVNENEINHQTIKKHFITCIYFDNKYYFRIHFLYKKLIWLNYLH